MSKRVLGSTLAAILGGVLAFGCSGSGSGGGVPLASTAAPATPAPTTSGSGAAPATTAPPATPPPSAALPATRTTTAQVVARHGEGFLEIDGGRRILHTKGTSYERGVQYGYLVGDQVEGVLRTLPAYVTAQGNTLASYAQALLTPAGSLVYRPYFDADALAEIRGIVDGMRARNPGTFVLEQDLIFLNSIVDLGATLGLDVFNCSSIAVWGDIARDRKTFQTRNIDLMVGSGLEDYTLTLIAKPDGGVAYLNPGYAGMIGCASGLNAHGIGVGQVWAFSNDKQFGRPWILATREILARGINVDDAIRVFQSDRRTYGSNFVFADRGDGRGGVARGVCLESTAHHLALFESDDPREDLALWNGQPYGIRIPFAVFRGDCALDPTIRGLQTASNGPTGDPRTSGAYQSRYEGQGTRVQAHVAAGTKVGRDELLQLSREVAMRRDSLQCCVYENTDLEVWVANARVANGQVFQAYAETYHNTSLDYYTPTASLVPDATTFARGSTLRIAVPVDTLGRERGLDLRVSLELGPTLVSFGADGTTTVALPERGHVTGALTVTVPANLANVGLGRLVLEVYEHGTGHLVEVAAEDVTVLP